MLGSRAITGTVPNLAAASPLRSPSQTIHHSHASGIAAGMSHVLGEIFYSHICSCSDDDIFGPFLASQESLDLFNGVDPFVLPASPLEAATPSSATAPFCLRSQETLAGSQGTSGCRQASASGKDVKFRPWLSCKYHPLQYICDTC